eukprot:EG_transcript_9795
MLRWLLSLVPPQLSLWFLSTTATVYLSAVSYLLRLLPRVFRGRWGQIPADLPLPTVRSITTANGPMQMLVWNADHQGLPIVCLHGLNSNPWLWARLAGCLLQSHPSWGPVYALAMPGHGEGAQQHDAPVDLDRTVETLQATLKELRVEGCAVLGHSWGGKVALCLAAARPADVKAVVLCDPVVPQGLCPVAALAPTIIHFTFLPERRIFPDQGSFDAGRKYLMHMNGAGDAMELNLWRGMYRPVIGGQFHPAVSDDLFWDIIRKALMQDISGKLQSIECPVLCIRPDLSVSFWPGATRPLQRLRQVAFRHVAGDHAFVHSNPLDAADAVAEFLAPLCATASQAPTPSLPQAEAKPPKSKLNPKAAPFVPKWAAVENAAPSS